MIIITTHQNNTNNTSWKEASASVACACLFFLPFPPFPSYSDSEISKSLSSRAKKAGFLKKSTIHRATSKKKSCALSLWSKENKARCFLKQREKNRTNTHSSRANLSSNRSRRIRARSNAREFRSFFFKFFLVFVLCRRIEGEATLSAVGF
jgi:CRISPR/Cas system CSM-associated protein Csm4 (group 5 of RAMP superfamily)